MCGRFSLAISKERISKKYQVDTPSEVFSNYNISPTQSAYVITNDNPEALARLQWGLIPHWSKDAKVGHNLINARRETIAGKPSFRIPIRKRRCLVLADGFYEWRKEGRQRIPYRITRREDPLMTFAGLWDIWQDASGELVRTFAIVTTPPNAEMADIHDRMPVILEGEEARAWLEDISLERTLNLLQTPPDGLLDIFPVSKRVNSVHCNSPDLYQRITLPPTLFD